MKYRNMRLFGLLLAASLAELVQRILERRRGARLGQRKLLALAGRLDRCAVVVHVVVAGCTVDGPVQLVIGVIVAGLGLVRSALQIAVRLEMGRGIGRVRN